MAQNTTDPGLALEPETRRFVARQDAERAAAPPNPTLDEVRRSYRDGYVRTSVAPSAAVTTSDLTITGGAGNIAARLHVPQAAEGRVTGLLLYVHGGGFAAGDLDSHDAVIRMIAEATGHRALAIHYRRAPENPYPAAREDVVGAFRWATAHAAELSVDPARIVLGGESAGGTHATAAALALRDAGGAGPRALWLMVPALDAAGAGESHRRFAEGAGRSAAEFQSLWSLYAPAGLPPTDPGLSPVHADPAGLPPVFIAVAEFDPARDDGETFARRAQAAGVPVSLRREPGLIHQFPEITGVSAASRDAVLRAATDLKAFLDAPAKSTEIDTPIPGATSRIVRLKDLAFQPFALPGFSGGTSGAFPNTDTSQAPFIAMLKMEPGAMLQKHYHPKAIEAVFVLDGEMINDGTPLAAGTFVLHGPGVLHGPHATETGCTLIFIQYPGVGPDDSVFVP